MEKYTKFYLFLCLFIVVSFCDKKTHTQIYTKESKTETFSLCKIKTMSERLCDVCNKAAGIYDCRDCQRTFCKNHVTEHNLELSKQMDDIYNQHDLLKEQLSNRHPLILEINNWEQESIEKIRNVAEKARHEFDKLFIDNKELITTQLEEISTQLETYKQTDDYTEKNLTEWRQALENLQKELSTPSNIHLEKVNDEQWLQRLEIITTSLNATENFEEISNEVRILENGCVAENGIAGHHEIRGSIKYSTGIHKIRLRIEKMAHNHWMFLGIISQNTDRQNNSYSSTSANGWSNSPSKGYLAGKCNNKYNSSKGNISENDILNLILNCDDRIIELENECTKEKYSIPIDLDSCPFPWKLHVNFYNQNDRIRILE